MRPSATPRRPGSTRTLAGSRPGRRTSDAENRNRRDRLGALRRHPVGPRAGRRALSLRAVPHRVSRRAGDRPARRGRSARAPAGQEARGSRCRSFYGWPRAVRTGRRVPRQPPAGRTGKLRPRSRAVTPAGETLSACHPRTEADTIAGKEDRRAMRRSGGQNKSWAVAKDGADDARWWKQAMLDVEAALAAAGAKGLTLD